MQPFYIIILWLKGMQIQPHSSRHNAHCMAQEFKVQIWGSIIISYQSVALPKCGPTLKVALVRSELLREFWRELFESRGTSMFIKKHDKIRSLWWFCHCFPRLSTFAYHLPCAWRARLAWRKSQRTCSLRSSVQSHKTLKFWVRNPKLDFPLLRKMSLPV